MRRSDVFAGVAVACVALGGCMRIYPDPELPDVETEWSDVDCRPGTGNVVVVLVEVATEARTEVSVPCTDLGVTFADVARVHYRVEAYLQGANGEPYGRSDGEADLRNGYSETVYLYFGGFSNYRVAWNFANGETCESLGVDFMYLQFMATDGSLMFENFESCVLTPHFGMAPDGTYTLRLSARSPSGTVATSAESPEFEIMAEGLTDLGIITLSP